MTTLPGSTTFSTPVPGMQLLQAPLHELIDIAVIVGEQHPGLHRAPVGAGVVDEAAQRIIDARRVEQGERPLGAEVELAVRRLVADRRQRRHGKEPGEVRRVAAAAREFVAAFDDVRVGNFLAPTPTSIAAPYSETSGSSCSSR